MVIVTPNTFPEEKESEYSAHFNRFPNIELSPFQKWSVSAIVDGNHSLVTAHTGSGKTLPAEFAIQYFVEKQKRVIYTAPIKALSNTKLADLRRKYESAGITFGIITGDITENPEADVLVMTTEILPATMIAKQANDLNDDDHVAPLAFEMDFEKELGAVIFDEVHYINDRDRGYVWEQAIMLLPPNVQMIMLSATIDRAKQFAEWVEVTKNKQGSLLKLPEKQVYLSSTTHRVVPLTHYGWFSVNGKGAAHINKSSPELANTINTPVVIKSQKTAFDEKLYNKLLKTVRYIDHSKTHQITRARALNHLIEHLSANNGLPAICFVFSRRRTEEIANQIQRPLFDDTRVQSTIEKDCESILRRKLPDRFKDYMALPEYEIMMRWVRKGVAVHHAGILPIFRELIEMLFADGKIKLIIATETLAVGVNFSTKSVIFTDVCKFDGCVQRQLLPHEYAQIAGRAGRRGIDTVGKIWICFNTIRHLPSPPELANMISGPPQQLQSHFKISYPLAMITATQTHVTTKQDFAKYSMLDKEMQNTAIEYKTAGQTLEQTLEKSKQMLTWCKTDESVIQEYIELSTAADRVSGKQKKRHVRQLSQYKEQHPDLMQDLEYYNAVHQCSQDIDKNKRNQEAASTYAQDLMKRTIEVLDAEQFIKLDTQTQTYLLTPEGVIAKGLHEVHPLALSKLITETKFLKEYSSEEIAAILVCFANPSIREDDRTQSPHTASSLVNRATKQLASLVDKYDSTETKNGLDSGSPIDIYYDMQTPVLEWCKVTSKDEASGILRSMYDAGVSSGDFVKAILKINNISRELSRVLEELGEIELMHKISKIPELTMKSIVTAESLYI